MLLFPDRLQDSTGQPDYLTSTDQAQSDDAGLHWPARLGSSPFMQNLLEASAFPASEQPHSIAAQAERSRSSSLQAGSARRQERSESIAIPGRPRTSASNMARAGSDFRPASAGDVSRTSARLSRRSSSGLLQGSPNARLAAAEDRLSSSMSPAGGAGLLQASPGFRPASAGETLYSSVSPAREGGSGLLRASLDSPQAWGRDIPYIIGINGSPSSDADQDTLVSRRNPSSADRRGASKNPVHSSSSQLHPNEEGDSQLLLTSLKSHRVSSFKHQEDAAGLSRRLQRALQACERARRQVMSARSHAQLHSLTHLQQWHCLVSAVSTVCRMRCWCTHQIRDNVQRATASFFMHDGVLEAVVAVALSGY